MIDWQAVRSYEVELLRKKSAEQSLQEYEELFEAFREDLDASEALFGAERRRALIRVQERIRRLNDVL